MKFFSATIIFAMLLSFTSCVNNAGNSNDSASNPTVPSVPTVISNPTVGANEKNDESPRIVYNEKFPDLNRTLVGDPMETYFYSEEYETKSDPGSKNPIYSEESFIKGTFPLDMEAVDVEENRVIIIQFKEDVDANAFFDKDNPAVTIIYGSHGKDVTKGFNFTYDFVSQKLLITKSSPGQLIAEGNFMDVTIHGDLMRTAEIPDEHGIEDGKEIGREGQRSRQLSGTYTFLFHT